MVGAGSVVTKDVPDFALVVGNPARFKYWISKTAKKLIFDNEGFAVDDKGNRYEIVKESDGSSRVKEL
jgi:UDP-2-acetamido-3-amino-2,3-dideoxy-glucuronate N-acetyltransferase